MTNNVKSRADSSLIATLDWEILSTSFQSLIETSDRREEIELKGFVNSTAFNWLLYLVNDGSVRLTLDGLTTTRYRFPTIYYDLKFGGAPEDPYVCRKGGLPSVGNGLSKDIYSYEAVTLVTIPLAYFENNMTHFITDDKLIISLQIYNFIGFDDTMDVNEIQYYWKVNAMNDGLVNDFAKLLKEAKHSDVTIVCAGEALKAHKCILSARSTVFSKMFETTTSQVTITDVDVSTIKSVLQFIYTGEVDLSNTNLTEIMNCAERYDLNELTALCLKLIAEREAPDMSDNPEV